MMRLVLVPTSALSTWTIEPPVTWMSISFWSVPLARGRGGRSVTTPYWRLWTMPATDVVLTTQLSWPKMRAKVSPKAGCRIVTWMARNGSQSTQLGEGLARSATSYGVPGSGHPAAVRQGDPTATLGVDVARSSLTRMSIAWVRAAWYWLAP